MEVVHLNEESLKKLLSQQEKAVLVDLRSLYDFAALFEPVSTILSFLFVSVVAIKEDKSSKSSSIDSGLS